MNELATVDLSTGELTQFEPQAAKVRDAKADAVIEYAQRVKDWPLLEQAVDAKLDQQAEFIDWWREKVTPNKGGDRPKGEKRGSALFVCEAESLTGITQQQVSKWAKRLKDREKYRANLYGVAWKRAMGELVGSDHIQQSLSNEHYTPAKYIEAAREVMGGIDLDPATCSEANKVVKAAEIFTAKSPGLDKPWHGRVWLNPPYGGLVGQFIEKLRTEIDEGRVESAIVLVNSHCTDTTWFQPLFDAALCFTDHRINFYGSNDRSGSTHGSVFAYFGDNRGLFSKVFSEFGAVVARIR